MRRTIGTAANGRRAANESGFTLVDLVIVIAIAAILATVAAPSFSTFIASQRASTAAMDLYIALSSARSEATKRNTNVTLKPATGGWQNGWKIEDPVILGQDLLVHDAVSGAALIGPDTVVYQRSGRVRGTAPTFTLTIASGSTYAKRCVQVDLNGRASIYPC
jgi:type IV fimbrial biogenesis protein FimT